MMLVSANLKLQEVLKETKKIADSHIPYAQEFGSKFRTANTEEGLGKMDCSELVCRYLYQLGVSEEIKSIDTSLMLTEANFRKYLRSDKIKFVPNSDKADFIPE